MKEEILQGQVNIPFTLPNDIAEMLEQMFVVDPQKRATAEQLSAIGSLKPNISPVQTSSFTKIRSFVNVAMMPVIHSSFPRENGGKRIIRMKTATRTFTDIPESEV
jgi:hypothetical protein